MTTEAAGQGLVVHVVFKTHLDIGFTDDSKTVVDGYLERYLPAAIALARQQREADSEDTFAWTVGSWLIHEALERLGGKRRKELEQSIVDGDIRWHALPFTTHTEYMDASLARHGLALSQALDRRFGRITVAAKMTDVPGHTAALVPLLADAGVTFLHIGVNPASAVPDVPRLCRWRWAGSEVMLGYEGAYGGLMVVPEAHCALAFGFTGDNHGPQTAEGLAAWYGRMREAHPGATIRATSLDYFARSIARVASGFPVVEAEIGDTWIHGVGTDPEKTRRFRALSRWRRDLLIEQPHLARLRALRRFSDRLLLVSEHTWGRDTKKFTPDWKGYHEGAWDKAGLQRDVKSGLHAHLERSWAEQRAYLDAAVAELAGSPLHDAALQAVARPPEPAGPWRPCQAGESLDLVGERLTLVVEKEGGTIVSLVDRQTGDELAGADNRLAVLRYEVFGSREFERFHESYNPHPEKNRGWSIPDFGKTGMEAVLLEGRQWRPGLREAWRSENGDALRLHLAFPHEAVQEFGAPADCWLVLKLAGGSVACDLRWTGKDASRVAEALWFGFHPVLSGEEGLRLVKMGLEIDPRRVVARGNRALHACERVLWRGEGPAWSLDLPDAALVAPGGGKLVQFSQALPDPRDGIEVNLWNNTWGTNFPMWYADDAVFRFSFNREAHRV